MRDKTEFTKKNLLILCFTVVLLSGCGTLLESIEDTSVLGEGTLYTKNNIFIDCIKTGYLNDFTSKIVIIENEQQLECALEWYSVLKTLPRFEEIVSNFPIRDYVYVIHFIRTDYESETYSCDGIYVDKNNDRIWFTGDFYKDEDDISQVVGGYIAYAVFPENELEGCDFSKQKTVVYPEG
ncbi:MAG: hypothetical protein K5929_10350 [Lachnospiraceae bacterium]|nr:hypothetical protein [Lachnospiraceae bacterium]